MPHFSYSIGPNADAIDMRHDLWKDVIPQDRITAGSTDLSGKGAGVSYGDYFCAARTFLEAKQYEHLRKAAARVLCREVWADSIESVDLHLIKHGQYYHPAKVTTVVNAQKLVFVLNMALSQDGQNIIAKEYDQLKRLNDEFPISFLPKVDAFGQVSIGSGCSIKMFLGEWFQDYHEFHLSPTSLPKQDMNGLQVVVWNSDHIRLNHGQTLDLIKKASMILTFYYNPETFESIFPWHHGAGDFVVKLEQNQLDVKMITARGYIPLLEGENPAERSSANLEQMLEAILLFLVQLSLRMRLDRIDGVGDLVLYDERYLTAIARGFFQGLDLVATMRDYPDDFVAMTKRYLGAVTPEQLINLVNSIVSRDLRLAANGKLLAFDPLRHAHTLIEAIGQDDDTQYGAYT